MNSALTFHPKTAATGLGTAGGLAVVWLLGLFNVTVTIEEAGVIVGAIAWVASWLAPIADTERSRIVHAAPVVTVTTGTAPVSTATTAATSPAPAAPTAKKTPAKPMTAAAPK